MNATNGTTTAAATKPKTGRAKPSKPPRVRAETLDIATLIGQPYDIETVLANTPTNVLSYLAKQAAQAQLSEYARRLMKGSSKMPAHSGDALRDAILAWAPSVKRRGKSPVEKVSRFLTGMTLEEKAELRAMLAENEQHA